MKIYHLLLSCLVAGISFGQTTHPSPTPDTSGNNTLTEPGATGDVGRNCTKPNRCNINATPRLLIDVSNNTNNAKIGLLCNNKLKTNPGGTIAVSCIYVDTYTPHDNGGESSGIYVADSGSSNAISAFNVAANRPPGYPLPNLGDGIGIELGVDHGFGQIIYSIPDIADYGFGTDFTGALMQLVLGNTNNSAVGLEVHPTSPQTENVSQKAIWVDSQNRTVDHFVVRTNGQTEISAPLILKANNTCISLTNQNGNAQCAIVMDTRNGLDIGGDANVGKTLNLKSNGADGNVDIQLFNDTIKLGASFGGSSFTRYLALSANITPGATTASQCIEQTFAFTGLATSDALSAVTPPSSLGTHIWIGSARPSARDTLAISFCADATAGTPPSGIYRVTAVH
jgi:hypothetical protein